MHTDFRVLRRANLAAKQSGIVVAFRRLILLILVLPVGIACAEPLRYPSRSDIPRWWQDTRSFYCPLANSGAGSSLMKYKTERTEGFESFHDLDKMLMDARRMGSNVLYLVDYWEPDYEHKSDYRPKLKWGGDAAFRDGVDKVHRLGGRVIVYLEALIITRDTELGRGVGREWAMMNASGGYYPYYGRDRFYLMYPGEGSGWGEYLAEVAGRLARDFKIDGVHLDSYGVHLDHVLPDHNPKHPDGRNTESFHRGAVRLVKRVREELRRHIPDAVVILEGAERTDLLEVCDGAQFESLDKLRSKPWHGSHRYPIFTSSFDLQEMQDILKAGHNLALSPWWLKAQPRGRDAKRLSAPTDKNNRFDQLESLHRYHNLLEANHLAPTPTADFPGLHEGIIQELNRRGWSSSFSYRPLTDTARRYLRAYELNQSRLSRTPADVLRESLGRAGGSQSAPAQ